MKIKIWVDDVRKPPKKDYLWLLSVNDVIDLLKDLKELDWLEEVYVLDLDHDSGKYYLHGGDYINILNWLEKENISIPIRIHSYNPVGVSNMRRIIVKNRWEEVKNIL